MSAAPKAKWSSDLQKAHAEMMSGVPDGKKPSEPSTDHAWKARSAYRGAFEEHVTKFLNGDLKHPTTDEQVTHREDALNLAHTAGLKAAQAIKKNGGLKMRVYAD